MTTPAKVNAALKEAGIAVEITRDNSGYYFFTGAEIPSLYSFNLHSYTTREVVDHVRKYLAEPLDTETDTPEA